MKKFYNKSTGKLIVAASREQAIRIMAGKFPYKDMDKSAEEILKEDPNWNSIEVKNGDSSDGSVCPFCGSDDSIRDDFDYNGDYCLAHNTCNKCKSEWRVSFELKPSAIFLKKGPANSSTASVEVDAGLLDNIKQAFKKDYSTNSVVENFAKNKHFLAAFDNLEKWGRSNLDKFDPETAMEYMKECLYVVRTTLEKDAKDYINSGSFNKEKRKRIGKVDASNADKLFYGYLKEGEDPSHRVQWHCRNYAKAKLENDKQEASEEVALIVRNFFSYLANKFKMKDLITEAPTAKDFSKVWDYVFLGHL